MAHELLDVMRSVLQAAGLQLLAHQLAKQKAATDVGIIVGDENGMAFEAIAEIVVRALVLPALEKRVRHQIMVNRQKQIGRQGIGARRAFGECLASRPVGDQQDRLPKPAWTRSRSMRVASRRLKSYSPKPRALFAPGDWAVWPTSTTIRNAARSQSGLGSLLAAPLAGPAQVECPAPCQSSSAVAAVATTPTFRRKAMKNPNDPLPIAGPNRISAGPEPSRQ